MTDRFEDREGEYGAWLASHRTGYVLNLFGSADPGYNLIHRATCPFLHRPKDQGHWTGVPKVCLDDLAELEREAERLLGPGRWRHCKSCFRVPRPMADTPTPSAKPCHSDASLEAPLPKTDLWVAGRPAVFAGAAEREWKARVEGAVRASRPALAPQWVDLRFCICAEDFLDRDVDNMTVPALEAMRDAGILEPGFKRLGTLTAAKLSVRNASQEGMAVRFAPNPAGTAPLEGEVIVRTELPGTDETNVKTAVYRAAATVREALAAAPFGAQELLRVDIRVGIRGPGVRKSMLDLLKPCVDGLEPLLGREDGAQPVRPDEPLPSPLAPLDHRVRALVVNVRGARTTHYAAGIRRAAPGVSDLPEPP